MTTNQWQGYTCSLLAKYDPTVEVPLLNMPVASSTASSGGLFTLTIGTNAAGAQLPNLTTLLAIGDVVTLRFKATFTATSFSDVNTANSLYPTGADGTVEPGHVAVCLSGANYGDVRTIESVTQDGNGNYTVFNLSSPWNVTPTTGDIVVIAAPNATETLSASVSAKYGISGVVAQPDVQNMAGKVWLFRVRTEDSNGNASPLNLAPMRELYLFGQGIERTVTSSTTQNLLDGHIKFDSTTAAITFTLLPMAQVSGRELILELVAGTNAVTINPHSGETFVDGSMSITLAAIGDTVTLKF
jgi:hypothetical protein